jgi:DNA polymerase-3 subunit epsilon
MKARSKFALWTAVLAAAALGLPAAIGLMLGAGLGAEDQENLRRIVSLRAPMLAFVAVILLFVCAGVVAWLFREYPGALRGLTEQTQVLLGVNDGLRVQTEGAREVAELAAVINRLGEARRQLRRDFDMRARESRARLEEERNRLAALMSELSEGVLVCNTEGRILLYNEQARALFAAADDPASAGLVGLGRSMLALLDRDQFAHALEKLQQSLAGGAPQSSRFVAPAPSGRLLRIDAAPFFKAEGEMAGLVLTLADVTGLLDREAQHLSLLQTLAAGVRAPVANVRAAAENLAGFPDMDAAQRDRFVRIIASESQTLSLAIEAALREYADALKASIALEDMRAADLVRVARRRIASALGIAVEEGDLDEALWLRVDSYAFVQALAFVAARLRDEHGVRRVQLSARPAGRFAHLDLTWSGASVAPDAVPAWESEPMRVGTEQTPLTLRDVLERHGGEAWLERASAEEGGAERLRFLMPAGEPVAAAPRAASALESRPEYYDFDLFAHSGAARELQERRLSELSYTVFDTETTGLEPSAGDEIISIGAVRIVNGRLLKNEVFEQLVDPCRPLNPQSARVHGIEARALAGQPPIESVLPAFHRFCEETVLVAHNAAFDMRFIELKEAAAGVRFTQPVLDTLLLSAVVQPNLEDHKLEAIAERLGVRVIGRHTALGDALLAGEIFLRLVALLAERGIVTLRQALEASRETYYARLHY